MATDFDFERFLTAQDMPIDESGQTVFEHACTELRDGKKATHWMWFIFPQLRGLGQSELAYRFGIPSLQEAGAYLDHPILGPRLRLCTELVHAVTGRTITCILGPIDAQKFCSCMTLFALATSDNGLFKDALTKYCSGQSDALTLGRLGSPDPLTADTSRG